jgi:hypothetical protein
MYLRMKTCRILYVWVLVYHIYNMAADVINEKLAQFLSEGQNWEKKPTNLPGVSLLKLPALKKGPHL